MTIYDDLGVPAVINAVGPATRLGGLPLHADVWAAMHEALATSVRMDVLERAAGRYLADALGVPAVYVTSGASAALFLATAVAMTRDDPALIDRLPEMPPLPKTGATITRVLTSEEVARILARGPPRGADH